METVKSVVQTLAKLPEVYPKSVVAGSLALLWHERTLSQRMSRLTDYQVPAEVAHYPLMAMALAGLASVICAKRFPGSTSRLATQLITSPKPFLPHLAVGASLFSTYVSADIWRSNRRRAEQGGVCAANKVKWAQLALAISVVCLAASGAALLDKWPKTPLVRLHRPVPAVAVRPLPRMRRSMKTGPWSS